MKFSDKFFLMKITVNLMFQGRGASRAPVRPVDFLIYTNDLGRSGEYSDGKLRRDRGDHGKRIWNEFAPSPNS